MPSSTSNSEISYRDIPDRPWPRLVAVALVLVFSALAGWEILARHMNHLPGDYLDNGSSWAIERRKVDSTEENVRVVLTGSSRILFAADLDILEERLGTRPIQLALPGTSPRIIVANVVNESDFDGLIFVGYTPFLFNDETSGFFGNIYIDAYHQESPSQRLGYQIHRTLSNYLGFLDNGFELFPLLDHYTSVPIREGAPATNANGNWKLGNMVDDRQTTMWEPIEERGGFDHQQWLSFWMVGLSEPPPPPEVVADMASGTIEFFRPLIAEMRSRGGDIVFIRMPSGGVYREAELGADVDTNLWNPHVEQLDALSINGWDYPELSTNLDIPEWSHLSRESQDRWSREVVEVLRQRYEEFRGESLNSMLGIDPMGGL